MDKISVLVLFVFLIVVPESTGKVCDRIYRSSEMKLQDHNETRWYHNDGVCQPFGFRGCAGSGNNFKTEEECKQRCVGKYQEPLVRRVDIDFFKLLKIVFLLHVHSQKRASCSKSPTTKLISGCVRIACSGLMITSLLQVVNRLAASCELHACLMQVVSST